MPKQAKVVVTNTTPLIALTAAMGNLDVLRSLYSRVVVPYEVAAEIRAGGKDAFGLDVFEQASWLEISPSPVVFYNKRRFNSDTPPLPPLPAYAAVAASRLPLTSSTVCLRNVRSGVNML